ncbi:hypothetical protein HK096_007812, partial [Nowakowskiella sp. JEL0078]
MATTSGNHRAAVLPTKKSALKVTDRPTPTPGPNEILVEVKSIALNPIDVMQRDLGFPAISFYPAVLGSDVGGIIVSVGSSVNSDDLKPGTRVTAYAPCFFEKGKPDYGAFQERVIIPAENVSPLPHNISFNEASLLPMAVHTALAGFVCSLGLPRNTKFTAADKKGILIWGAGGSVGNAAVQVAKLFGFTVYTTSSTKNHEYLKSLGANRTFDYKSKLVESEIIKAAKEDGISLTQAFVGAGQYNQCLSVLKALKGNSKAKIAMAPFQLSMFWWRIFPGWGGADVNFIVAPATGKEKSEFFHFVFRVWLKEKLTSGEFVPSPKTIVISKGLESIQESLNDLKKGVSGVKLVVEV